MFKRGQENEGSSAGSPLRIGEKQPIRSKNVSVIGPTLVFRGELSADEDLVIEGTIGKLGRVTADIHASSVIVEGELNGDIHSDGLVSLANGATVNGNVFCARLVMQDGATFNGKVDMAIPTPIKAAPDPEEIEDEFAEAENLTA